MRWLFCGRAVKPDNTAVITASFLRQRERPERRRGQQRRQRPEQRERQQRRRQERRPVQQQRRQQERREPVRAQRQEREQEPGLLLFCRKRSGRKRQPGRRSGASVSWYLRKRFQKMAIKRRRRTAVLDGGSAHPKRGTELGRNHIGLIRIGYPPVALFYMGMNGISGNQFGAACSHPADCHSLSSSMAPSLARASVLASSRRSSARRRIRRASAPAARKLSPLM